MRHLKLVSAMRRLVVPRARAANAAPATFVWTRQSVNNMKRTTGNPGLLACALSLAVALPAGNHALAFPSGPGFEVVITDSTNSAFDSTNFYTGTAASPTPVDVGNSTCLTLGTGCEYVLGLNMNTNYPGGVSGTLSSQVTIESSASGALDNIAIRVFVADGSAPSTPLAFTSPVGTRFGLFGSTGFSPNGSLTGGDLQGSSSANVTNTVTSPTLTTTGSSSGSSSSHFAGLVDFTARPRVGGEF
jgi:hypothetical protein